MLRQRPNLAPRGVLLTKRNPSPYLDDKFWVICILCMLDIMHPSNCTHINIVYFHMYIVYSHKYTIHVIVGYYAYSNCRYKSCIFPYFIVKVVFSQRGKNCCVTSRPQSPSLAWNRIHWVDLSPNKIFSFWCWHWCNRYH